VQELPNGTKVDTLMPVKLFFEQKTVTQSFLHTRVETINNKLDKIIKKLESKKDTINKIKK